ncbi:hypothetical protein [Singulisphaera acidiphila]|uniref:Uncharacterized protein n=1 Tax=Singulisphaera acidiphila (strain ATCC BAA-1392 / DSM 18658 / VKM B-2454 / MOB10) TaxID=886293 RepID=L0DAB0_SINAD|nr:hypothetical protein [Singulisphaera acidiphila]AGA26187.1 hypothetical protein Sinac_1822 [Singulisphaera acidiphila DSM 18658]
MLPPIRYPLPTLVLLVILGLITWRGETMIRPLKSALAERWQRQFEGPPVPNSTEPKVVAGPIIRKALLLHDDVITSDHPAGSPSETIRLRMFVDIYDVWPLSGPPDFYRVGNRRPIGWVNANDLLPWETRLVVHVPDDGSAAADARASNDHRPTTSRPALPVLSWTADSVEVARWDEALPWQAVSGRVPIRLAALRPEDWGVWISRPELLSLLRRTGPNPGEPAKTTRLRAILGRLSDDRPLSAKDQAAAIAFLPAQVFMPEGNLMSILGSNESLARVNENWKPEASWGGVSFQFLPLSALP